MKKIRRYFNRFGATHERIGRTDRQTDGQTPSDTSKKHSVNKIAIIMHSIARQKYMLCVCMSMCIHRYTPLDTWSIQLFFMFIHIHTCIASILFISSFVKHYVSNAYHMTLYKDFDYRLFQRVSEHCFFIKCVLVIAILYLISSWHLSSSVTAEITKLIRLIQQNPFAFIIGFVASPLLIVMHFVFFVLILILNPSAVAVNLSIVLVSSVKIAWSSAKRIARINFQPTVTPSRQFSVVIPFSSSTVMINNSGDSEKHCLVLELIIQSCEYTHPSLLVLDKSSVFPVHNYQ